MTTGPRWRFLSLFGLAVVVAALFWGFWGPGPASDNLKEDTMFRVSNNDWAEAFEPFASDVEEIETLWDQPIPDDLGFIGGPDWPAWGAFFRHPDDPAGVIRGQARDRLHLYVGLYRAESGNFDVSAGVPFEAFELHGLDGDRVLLRRRDQAAPVDYFFLAPASPEDIRRPTRP